MVEQQIEVQNGTQTLKEQKDMKIALSDKNLKFKVRTGQFQIIACLLRNTIKMCQIIQLIRIQINKTPLSNTIPNYELYPIIKTLNLSQIIYLENLASNISYLMQQKFDQNKVKNQELNLKQKQKIQLKQLSFLLFLQYNSLDTVPSFHFMCELLDEAFYYVSSKNTKIQSSDKNQEILDYKNLLEDSIFSPKIIRLTNNHLHQYKAVWIVRLIQQNIDLLIEAYFGHSQFYFKAKSLDNMCLFSVELKEYRKILIKQISTKCYMINIDPYKVVFSLQNGQWYIKSPVYYKESKGKQFNSYFNQAIGSLLKKLNKSFQFFSKISRYKKEQISEVKKGKIKQIIRYYSRCTTAPSISIKSDCAEYQSVLNRYAASRCDLEDLTEYNNEAIKTTKIYFRNLWIYGIDLSLDDKFNDLQEISLRQKQKIQQEISIPSYAVSRAKQNKYNFNHCYFLNTIYQERKINVGGNAEIFVLKPQIYQYNSSVSETQNIVEKSENISRYTVKHVVYKKAKQNSNILINGQKNVKEIKNNEFLDRQTEIVSCLRAGSCLFLPKYYLNIQKNSPYSKKLLIQYLPGQTLDQYMTSNTDTISFFTKIYLILQILQTLRFLATFGIVHLDLKQSNIIVLKKVICRIIDFGQSYNYKVCGLNHKPKYTLTYAPPQVVTSLQGRAFTEKSDVFSFGILIHNLLFGKHPYFFSNQQSFQKANFQKSLRNKTFIVPQQIEGYGDKIIIKILHQLILKCICLEQQKRPYLDWITLVFKTCFNYLTSQ